MLCSCTWPTHAAHATERAVDAAEQQPIAALIAALADPCAEARWAAAESLGMLGASEAVPALIAVLGDTHGLVRGMAQEALRRIGGPEAERAFGQTLLDAYVRPGIARE